MYKISLNNTDINKILEIFKKDTMKQLKERHCFYFYDLDSTVDIKGAFNKEELINFLCDEYG